MSSPGSHGERQRPAVDERLVAPESGYEIDDGKLIYVSPSDPPHATRHSKIAALLEAHVAEPFDVAVDMLTRTSERSDIAPDLSVFPRASDPVTGGRCIEELAFEVVSTESLGHAGHKARSLVERGVRRVFAIDVSRARAFEWSDELAAWSFLDPQVAIEDPCLAVPLPIDPLVRAIKADDAMAAALRAKRHPEFLSEREEGRAEGRAEGLAAAILAVLASRRLDPSPEDRRAILEQRDQERLERWLTASLTAASVADVLGVG